MQAWIYKGKRKPDTYLYVASKDQFDPVPDALIKLLGDLSLVMDIDLHAEQKLARADVNEVRQQINQQGYFLQMPPGDLKTKKIC